MNTCDRINGTKHRRTRLGRILRRHYHDIPEPFCAESSTKGFDPFRLFQTRGVLWFAENIFHHVVPLASPSTAGSNANPSSQSCAACLSASALSSSDVYSRNIASGVHRRAFRIHWKIADNRFLKKKERCAWGWGR